MFGHIYPEKKKNISKFLKKKRSDVTDVLSLEA